MSKAKQQAYQNAQPTSSTTYAYPPPSSGSFAWGFFLGQLTLASILFVFIKFFIFGDAPSADERAAARAAARRQRTLSHTRQQQQQQQQSHHRTLSTVLRSHPAAPAVLKARSTDGGLTVQKILEKTYYHVSGHQPESLDWFNVLIAQTIAQLRADAQEDEGVLRSLTGLMNGAGRPSWMDEIRVTEISLGDEFPIFSNCRVIPVDEHGVPIRELTGKRGERLQARMDVDLSDVLTLGVETKLVLNYPKPFVMVLPVALAVSVVRFSGTLSVSFSPSSVQSGGIPVPSAAGVGGQGQAAARDEDNPLNMSGRLPTTLTFTFLDDYRLDLSIRSLIGSRSRLQDVPKIAQLIEARIHQWFDERCVEPRFQQIVLPSLWPRMKTARGGNSADDDNNTAVASSSGSVNASSAQVGNAKFENSTASIPDLREERSAAQATEGASLAEQRTRDWAAKQTAGVAGSGKRKEELSEIELAGQEMREAEERARRRDHNRLRQEQERAGVRMRRVREGGVQA